MIRVLAVEDSAVILALIEPAIRASQVLEWLPPARQGLDALDRIRRYKPDVILLDLNLPLVNGLEIIRRIMSEDPRPIVVLSGHLQSGGVDQRFEALKLGAVEVLSKPHLESQAQQAAFEIRLARIIELAARAKLVRRVTPRHEPKPAPRFPFAAPKKPATRSAGGRAEVLLIGSSTGGPPLLFELLEVLGRRPDSKLSVLLFQHIIPGYEAMLARWLTGACSRLRVAEDGDAIEPGAVVLIPAGPLSLEFGEHAIRLKLLSHPGDDEKAWPNLDEGFALFAPIAEKVAALVLTGMGRDGAAGLKALHSKGAQVAVQNPETCVIDSMPAAALASLGSSTPSLSPSELRDWIETLAS